MNIKEFLWEFRYIILWALSIVVMCIIMGWQWTKQQAYALMLKAKQMSKDGFLKGGQLQEEWAVKALYLVFKKIKIPFVTEENLRPVVHKLYVAAMDKLDDGQVNKSIQ
jgi:hypothetical protein